MESSANFLQPATAWPPDDQEILTLQRGLRKQLFEGPNAIRWRPGRELAAELLLYLDDPLQCWRMTTEWLRDMLDADRVDGGFGGFVAAGGQPRDYIVAAEAQREAFLLPSVLGLRFSAANPGLRAVWNDTGVATITDVSQERSFTEDLRVALHEVGTSAKLALPIRYGDKPVGMVCADWHHETPRWDPAVCNELATLSVGALGPLLATASQLARARREREQDAAVPVVLPRSAHPGPLADLTPAELRVARLVAGGMSYKELAHQLDRSLSTVDHQLRSIRDKLGVRSMARLVHLLHDHFDQGPN